MRMLTGGRIWKAKKQSNINSSTDIGCADTGSGWGHVINEN